jgi:hypothetical protein
VTNYVLDNTMPFVVPSGCKIAISKWPNQNHTADDTDNADRKKASQQSTAHRDWSAKNLPRFNRKPAEIVPEEPFAETFIDPLPIREDNFHSVLRVAAEGGCAPRSSRVIGKPTPFTTEDTESHRGKPDTTDRPAQADSGTFFEKLKQLANGNQWQLAIGLTKDEDEKQASTAQGWGLGGPWAAQGWPKGHPSVAQGSNQVKPFVINTNGKKGGVA